MEEKGNPANIQNDFFNQARRDKARLTVFLNSGKKLTGRIKSFDRFTIILDGPGGEQMIFKHAIATISSTKTFGNYMDFEGVVRDRGRPGTSEPATRPAAGSSSGSPEDPPQDKGRE